MDRVKVDLLNPAQAHKVLSETVWPTVKAHLLAGQQLVLEVRGMTRTTEQNAMLHSILKDLSEQVKWFDRHLTQRVGSIY